MGITESMSSGSAVELEFAIRNNACFFIDVSARETCRVDLEHLIHRSDELLLEFFSVEGGSTDRILEIAEASSVIADARLVEAGADNDLFEFVVSGPCVTTTLADAGAVTRAVSAENGRGRIVADVPSHADVRDVVETFRSRHDDAELVAQRNREQPVPVQTRNGALATIGDRLTTKQFEVLRTAYAGGYFGWPRERTADECAQALGISQPTFSQHIRTAQEKVFEALFEDDRAAHDDRLSADENFERDRLSLD